jgi:hypothetical protein
MNVRLRQCVATLLVVAAISRLAPETVHVVYEDAWTDEPDVVTGRKRDSYRTEPREQHKKRNKPSDDHPYLDDEDLHERSERKVNSVLRPELLRFVHADRSARSALPGIRPLPIVLRRGVAAAILSGRRR